MPLKDIGKIDVLRIGHHGSKTSSSDAFIKAIAPKCAVIWCDKDNEYRHPHQETTATLNKYDVTTYKTELNGTVIVTSDEKNVTIATENKTTDKPFGSEILIVQLQMLQLKSKKPLPYNLSLQQSISLKQVRSITRMGVAA